LKNDEKAKLVNVNSIIDNLKTDLSKIDDDIKLENKITCAIKIGDSFNTIPEIFDFEGNKTSLEHKQG